MGKDFESIGRPLPHRENWVLLGSNEDLNRVFVVSSLKTAVGAHQDTELAVW